MGDNKNRKQVNHNDFTFVLPKPNTRKISKKINNKTVFNIDYSLLAVHFTYIKINI